MKTILVPTDFSEISANAIDYAVEISKSMHARIVLFHAYHVPVVASDVTVFIPDMDEFKRSALENLKKIENTIRIKHGENINIECKCAMGFAVDEINLYTRVNSVDMIVMGMHGRGYLIEKIIGSITTSLLGESNCPVMAIDQKVKFRALKKIALACDYKHIKKKKLELLKDIAVVFDAHIDILNIVKEPEAILSDAESAVCGLSLNHTFANIDHSFQFTTNEHVVDGINEYVSSKQMDMVVMIPRKHTVLEKLFNESNTKRMAFHTSLPVLALHE